MLLLSLFAVLLIHRGQTIPYDDFLPKGRRVPAGDNSSLVTTYTVYGLDVKYFSVSY